MSSKTSGNPVKTFSHREDDTVDDNTSVPNPSRSEDRDKESVVFVLEQLLNLMKLTFQTSSKVVTPALSQLVQSLFPTFQRFFQLITPLRLHQYLELLASSIHNIFKILSQSTKGKEVTSQIDNIVSDSIHFLASDNSRQVIVESVGVIVKGIDSIRTPEMKIFVSSIPVLIIRIIDTLSSGEAKLLYHSFFELLWKTIELLGQDETTIALAETTAQFIHVLESERYVYGPRSKGRKQRRVKVAGLSTRDSSAAVNSKKRYTRNRYTKDTYSNRVILDDASDLGIGVEDAILSSIGEGTRSDHAWLTSLGKQEDYEVDESSLPSRVILLLNKDEDFISTESIHLLSPLKRDETIENAIENQEDILDLTYLRESIKLRHENSRDELYRYQSDDNLHGDNLNTTTRSVAGDSICIDDEDGAIEDLFYSGDLVYNESRETLIRGNIAGSGENKTLAHEDDSVDPLVSPDCKVDAFETTENSNFDVNDGRYSSLTHFYRTLSELEINGGKIPAPLQYSTKADREFNAKESNRDGISLTKRSVYKTLPKCFQPSVPSINEQHEEEHEISWTHFSKLILNMIPKKYKTALGLSAIILLLGLTVWLILGCFGLMYIFHRISSLPLKSMDTNEIVIRIVRDNGLELNGESLVEAAVTAIEIASKAEL
jgi:hypothetical protein